MSTIIINAQNADNPKAVNVALAFLGEPEALMEQWHRDAIKEIHIVYGIGKMPMVRVEYIDGSSTTYSFPGFEGYEILKERTAS